MINIPGKKEIEKDLIISHMMSALRKINRLKLA